MEEGKMNEKQKEQLKVAARYGVCNGKYLGELIDQIRMAGVNKNDLRAPGSPSYGKRMRCD